MRTYKTPRFAIGILLKITIALATLLCLTVAGLFVFALAVGGGREVLSLLPRALVMIALVILCAGVTYALLHGILAVFDIADSTAARSAERTSERAAVKATPRINHDDSTPVAYPAILGDDRVPRRR